MKGYPFKHECQMEMLRTGEPHKVGKAYGVHRETARVWWNGICEEQETSGGIGTWSLAAIERELAMSRVRAKMMSRKETVGNLTDHRIFEEEDTWA